MPQEELARGEAAIGRPIDVRIEVRAYALSQQRRNPLL